MSKLGFLGSEYKKIRENLDLGLYSDDLKGNSLDVWVNWSKDFNERVDEANATMKLSRMAAGPEIQAILKRASETLDSDDVLFLRPFLFVNDEAKTTALRGAVDAFNGVMAVFWDCAKAEVDQIMVVDLDLYGWCIDNSMALRKRFQETRKKAVPDTGNS